MTAMKNHMNEWTFPERIDYNEVPEYLRRFEAEAITGTLVFDLRDTEVAHSSFIGFLIVAKHAIEKSGHDLVLRLSPALERLLAMLHILEYFSVRAHRAEQRLTA